MQIPGGGASAEVLFSIIVPTLHREHLLLPLLDAVAAQISARTGPIELLLVDNSPEGSAQAVMANAPGFVRYVHEPKSGYAQARNRGIAEAPGSHLIFLDDDQMPEPGWLEALAAAAASGDRAAFGSVETEFLHAPPAHLLGPLERIFGRQFPGASGCDLGPLRAYLATGNSMFHRDVLALESPPFDPAFDSGGEDVSLLRKLVEEHGIVLAWRPEARVHEIVPDSRVSMDFLRRRRFSNGQLRCVVESRAGGARAAVRVAVWMAVGAVQAGFHGVLALALWPVSRRYSTHFQLAAIGGVGKLLWWMR